MPEEKRVNVRYPKQLGVELKKISKETKISQNQLIVMATRELIRQYKGEGFKAEIKQ